MIPTIVQRPTALRHFLADRLARPVGPLRLERLTGGLSQRSYRISDGSSSWVLRLAAPDPAGESLRHMAREYRVLRALAGTRVPVPRPVAIATEPALLGAPFSVLDWVDGVSYLRKTSRSPGARLTGSVVDVLADLHAVDPAACGLSGQPAGYLERQLDLWQRRHFRLGGKSPRLLRIFHGLRENLPTRSGTAVVHGDYHLGNLLFDTHDRARVSAVLDWELATLGDPLADVGYLAACWSPPGEPANPLSRGLAGHPELGTIDQLLQRYTAASGADLTDIHWYIVLAEVKIAALLKEIRSTGVVGELTGFAPVLLERAHERVCRRA